MISPTSVPAHSVPRIYDCFTFFDELEILEVRLHELAATVDRFVLVEATRTFTGMEKELTFARNRERFAAFPIDHIVVDDMPAGDDPWEREAFQRNAIVRGLKDASLDDLIVISDVDEIPRASALAALSVGRPVPSHALEMRFAYYAVNWSLGHSRSAVALLSSALHAFGSPQAARGAAGSSLPVVPGAGWHFSYFGVPARIRSKLLAFSHREFGQLPFIDPAFIANRVTRGEDLFGRFPLEYVAEPDVPLYVAKNQARFAHWFVPPPLPEPPTDTPMPIS